MEERISISEIIRILKKRWKLIVVLILITTSISGFYSYFVLKPIYQASTQILVNQKKEAPLDPNQVQSNVDFINTYSVIIKSPAILEKAIKHFQIEQSVGQLNQKITINSQEKSQVFSLTVEDSDPTMALKIANALSETFQKEIPSIMKIDNVSILARAEHPILVQTNLLLNLTIGIMIGLMAGIGLVLLLDFMNKTIRDGQYVESHLGLPVLGSIQKFPKAYLKKKKSSVIPKMGSDTIESFVQK